MEREQIGLGNAASAGPLGGCNTPNAGSAARRRDALGASALGDMGKQALDPDPNSGSERARELPLREQMTARLRSEVERSEIARGNAQRIGYLLDTLSADEFAFLTKVRELLRLGFNPFA